MKLMRMLAVGTLLASSHLVYGQRETQVMTVDVCLLPLRRVASSCPRAALLSRACKISSCGS